MTETIRCPEEEHPDDDPEHPIPSIHVRAGVPRAWRLRRRAQLNLHAGSTEHGHE